MTEERITETHTPEGQTHTHTTVITDKESGGGMGKWIGLVLLAVVAIAALIIFQQFGDAEVAKDNAVANAANEVGEAADQVGNAAGQAGEAIENAVE